METGMESGLQKKRFEYGMPLVGALSKRRRKHHY
jgi:hypothetical protein